ncbi:MAG TPA: hypothetical protein VFC67_13800 [Prolixibacteraceae bacterium]|nr:hypothetical protein [Prolixibacteraceae bacterium]
MKAFTKYLFSALFVSLFFYSCSDKSNTAGKNNVVIENAEFRLIIGSDAKAVSLFYKPTGQECLQKGIHTPVFSLTQYRPYDNEIFLTYPAKTKIFYADTVYRVGNDLIVGFELEAHRATIGLTITDNYIGFTLNNIDYDISKVGIKRRTEIDEFTMLQLPVRDRGNFGEWLNVSWDKDVAVNILGTDPYAKIDAVRNDGYHLMQAGMETKVKLMGVGCALIVTSKDKLLDRVDQLEQDYHLPRGVQSRRNEAYKYSYYELQGVTPQNIDENIAFAKQAGFRMMVVNYLDFATSMGHFPWNSNFPNGMADLQTVTRKIKEAGMIPGFHIHYSKASKNDSYVTPVPDSRLNLVRIFTLSAAIAANSTIISVEENPEGCTLENERRFLKIGNELVTYEQYTTMPPYQFTGCKRGALSTKISEFEKGFKFGLLDVDTWPIFVRFDQYTSIQQEVAERLGRIYADAGFRFVYFDGAEDVNLPYWFTVSKSQEIVYNCLNPKPLVSEGAIKSHFGWHILSRGNAFDVFAPEVIKQATAKYQASEAKYIAQDFTSINFGWIGYRTPDSTTIGIQPDMLEYICSRGAAWDCPISLQGNLDQLKSHHRTADNLEVIRRWEEARINNFFSAEQKKMMQYFYQEHILLINETGGFELCPYQQIQYAAKGNPEVRAFIFQHSGKTYVVYWHNSGEGKLKINVTVEKVHLFMKLDTEIKVEKDGVGIIVPLGERRYLQVDLPFDKVIVAFKEAVLL